MRPGTDGSSLPERVPAERVAESFVKKYYDLLERTPEDLYKFYKDWSTFSFSGGSNGGVGLPVVSVGQAAIKNSIMAVMGTFPAGPKKVVRCFSGQDSRQGGVLVLVTGHVSVGEFRQDFTESFFLDVQREPYPGYYVVNDALRFLVHPPHSVPTETRFPLPQPLPLAQEEVLVSDAQPALGAVPVPAIAPSATVAPAVAAATCEEAEPDEEVEEQTDRVAEVELDVEDDNEEEAERHENEGLQEEIPTQPADEEEHADEHHEEQNKQQQGSETQQQDDTNTEDMSAWQDQPQRSWASHIASRLGQGGGGLSASKLQGYAAPNTSASRPAQPTPTTGKATGKAGIKGDNRYPPAGTSGASSAAGTASTSQATGYSAPSTNNQVWVWISRLPTEQPAELQELKEVLNSYLADNGCEGRVEDLERRDLSQEWASILFTSQEASDVICGLSRDRQLMLRGRSLKAEPHRHMSSGVNRRGGGGRGGGRGDRGDDDKRRETVGYHASTAGSGEGRGRGGGGGSGGGKRRAKGGGSDGTGKGGGGGEKSAGGGEGRGGSGFWRQNNK